MHRIDTPTAQIDKFGQGKNGFTNGDPVTGRRATDLNSDMWDAVQEEIANAIEGCGITLDKSKHNQLYLAIQRAITERGFLKKANNLSDLTDPAAARANLYLGKLATVNWLTADKVGAVDKTGDTMSGSLTVPYVACTPEVMPEGAGAYADQLNHKAPFYQPNWQWSVNASGIFVPIAKGVSSRKGQGYPGAVSFGYLMPGNNEHPHPTIHIKGDSNVDTVWDFNPYSGAISSKAGTFATQEWVNTAVHTNELKVGSAQMASDGNIMGSRWGNKWLWDAITDQLVARDNNINSRATWDYVNQNFVRDIRLAARGEIMTDGAMTEAPWGAVITGGNGNEGDQLGYMYFRYLQKNVNGNWYTVAYA
ncbi:phage tail protein [Serratia bockelmannii]|uniref:phage tail protein n=1 Tax=Serratia bockelmannii TaxID=2703793 RepID=UPI00224009F7|nr:phage tail protein [Serratia bockelmannii]MCW7646210.1 phage tail protein [Serratia bockelmannii]MCW7655995.1 phage tail protein [Serratia bockelmannii]MCW7675780.1 phage tail protein [Serratia bockelmannii]MCW7680558.1 phage tail protein [Serratia bockelmannii]MCW7685334.1 phage tail protein [Serratia bockelmannii]